MICLRTILTGGGQFPPFPLRFNNSRVPETLSPVATDILLDWLRKAVPRWLARSGGAIPCLRPFSPGGGKLPLWIRYPGDQLHLVFDKPAWDIVRWLTRLDLGPGFDFEKVAPPPPPLVGSTGQAFLAWRLVDSLPENGPWGRVRSQALTHWISKHLLLWLGYPLSPNFSESLNWGSWLEGGLQVQLEGCQGWLRNRWLAELSRLASETSDTEQCLVQIENLSARGSAWLTWAGPTQGRWDFAAPLYLALRSDRTAHLIGRLARWKALFFQDGIAKGQEIAKRLQCLGDLLEKLGSHHHEASSRLYFDEDHDAAQCLLDAITLPGFSPDWKGWATSAAQQIRELQNP